MEITFEKQYLEDLYFNGSSNDKKHRYQPQVVKRYIRVINILRTASRVEDLFPVNSLNYEVLKGDKAGVESVRVGDQYRIEFKTNRVVNETVVTICNILELSNHYSR